MKTEHTPGPWEVYPLDDKFLIQSPNGIPGSPYAHLARVNQMSNEVGEANARLIAAAPDLLEALQAFIDHANYHSIPVGSGMWMQMKNAIAKATGEREGVI